MKKQSKKSIDIHNKERIPAIEERNIGGVGIRLMYDTRNYKKEDRCLIAVCVTYSYKRWYYPTGTNSSLDDYLRIVNAGTQGKWCEMKKDLVRYFNYVETAVKELITDGFSLEKLKERIGKGSKIAKTDLFGYWEEIAETKRKYRTKQGYLGSLNSFKKFRNNVNLMVGDVTETMIEDWKEEMESIGNGNTTQAIYLRSLRAILNCAIADNIITKKPKIIFPVSSRRTDNFIPVADILKLKSFVAPDDWTNAEKKCIQRAIDWWLILYCCNGCNTVDLAELKWNDNYFYDNELSFIRSKIRSKKEIEVKIPVIPELKELLKKYGSIPEKNKLVFPQILRDAATEKQKVDRIHGFNKKMIRKWLVLPCEKLGIRNIGAQFARNSFITTLTHHGVSDSYIDRAVGHTDNLLRGYQGGFSKKKRYEFNSQLFIDPELD
ncbi:MAG: site-specific integrase [Lentimicrobiaceae bacterium]|nr:site-specific integrase [Lentimicrobiaceae bacterium]